MPKNSKSATAANVPQPMRVLHSIDIAAGSIRLSTNIRKTYRYIRADFYLARSFEVIDDMNRQLRHWLDTVANVRCHGTTGRIVAEHFREEQPHLQPLPAGRFDTVLRIERRVSHEGCVSVGGNYYSVPDGTRKRVLDVETTADTIRIFEDGALIATHARIEGRRARSVLTGHRLLQRIMQPQAARVCWAASTPPGSSANSRTAARTGWDSLFTRLANPIRNNRSAKSPDRKPRFAAKRRHVSVFSNSKGIGTDSVSALMTPR